MSITSSQRKRRARVHPILSQQHESSFKLGACQRLTSATRVVSVAAPTNRSLGAPIQRLLAHDQNDNTNNRQQNSQIEQKQEPQVAANVAQLLAPAFMNAHQSQHESNQLLLNMNPQATAQAMVGAARATLVILMGVLVTKLIITSNKKETSQSERRSHRSRLVRSEQSESLNSERAKQMPSSQSAYNCYYEPSGPLPEELPPGPRGFPLVGYLPFLGSDLHVSLTQLSNKYGPIYQIFLGSIRVVVLTDASLVRQAFRQPVFSGRPNTQLTRILQGYGIVNSDGALWREQRAFVHSALRKLGLKSLMNGSSGLEAKIQVSDLDRAIVILVRVREEFSQSLGAHFCDLLLLLVPYMFSMEPLSVSVEFVAPDFGEATNSVQGSDSPFFRSLQVASFECLGERLFRKRAT